MKRNPWPYAIIAYFAVFIAAMAGWIAFAMRHDLELVRPDYYQHELEFQRQIEQAARASAVRSGIAVAVSGKVLSIALPSEQATGEVYLYRPSDARLDRRFPIRLDGSGRQEIGIGGLQPGYWKARVTWRADGHDYYFDQPLVLGGD